MSEKLTLTIERDESGTFFVTAHNLQGVYGVGDSITQALESFGRHMTFYYHELLDTPTDRLGQEVTNHLAYLRQIFDMPTNKLEE